MKKRFISMLLTVSLSLSLVTPCMAATEADTPDAQLLVSNATENIAEAKDGDTVYRAHFDKVNNVITLFTYNDNKVVDKQVIDLNQYTSNVYSQNSTPDLPGFKQSETGFGYLLGDSINEYSCSYELVENGTYEYYGIRLRTTTQAGVQGEFRATVNNMCAVEAEIKTLSDWTALTAIATVVVACISLGSGAAAVALASLGLSIEVEAKAKVLAEYTDQCAGYFAYLYRYKI